MITRRALLRDGALGGLGALAATRVGAISTISAPVMLDHRSALSQGGWATGIATPQLTLDDQPVPTAAHGLFFLGFDRDAAQQSVLASHWGDGEKYEQSLTIAPRPWRIEQVNTPLRPPAVPDEAFAKIRSAEVERINAARAVGAQAGGWQQTFQWPAKGRLSGLFGSQRVYQGTPGAYHGGTDIALPAGTVYNAPADGVVVLAADYPFTLEGNLLMIDHGMGLISAFLHSSALLVREGERVVQGQPIGRVGMTGRATGPHLHWGMRWREARLDPMLFAGSMA